MRATREKGPQPRAMERKQRVPAGRRLRAAALLAFLPLAGLSGLALWEDQYGQRDRARPAEVIVVLGAGVTSAGVPGDSLRARTLQAVDLYRRGLAPRILCTGGVGDHPPAESVAACRLAAAEGVPARALFREEQSTSTAENARYAAEVCRAHGWRRVLLVSDPYHLLRGQRDFERFGLTVHPSPARNCVRNRRLPLRIGYALREAVLLVRDFVLGAR